MSTKKFKIIVIDDEPKITKLLKLILLENFDCEIETHNEPAVALERLREQHFDAISLDHRMPTLTGMDIVKLLKTSQGPNNKTKILLLTGFRDEAECAANELLNDVIFLEKPIDGNRYVTWMKVLLFGKNDASASLKI